MSSQSTTYRAWAFTVRPRNGISDERIKDFVDWMEKSDKIECAYAITEKLAEERHLHAILFFNKDNGRRKGDINKQLERIFQKRDVEDGELKVLRMGTRIVYNSDYLENYLDKDDNTVEVCDKMENYDPGIDVEGDGNFCCPYFPTQAEQDAVQKQSNAVDQYFHSLAVKYEGWLGTRCNDMEMVKWWFGVAMFSDKTIKVITDTRKLNQIVVGLYRYTNSNELCLIDESSAMGQMILAGEMRHNE